MGGPRPSAEGNKTESEGMCYITGGRERLHGSSLGLGKELRWKDAKRSVTHSLQSQAPTRREVKSSTRGFS